MYPDTCLSNCNDTVILNIIQPTIYYLLFQFYLHVTNKKKVVVFVRIQRTWLGVSLKSILGNCTILIVQNVNKLFSVKFSQLYTCGLVYHEPLSKKRSRGKVKIL